jgi:hypothetical protein
MHTHKEFTVAINSLETWLFPLTSKTLMVPDDVELFKTQTRWLSPETVLLYTVKYDTCFDMRVISVSWEDPE